MATAAEAQAQAPREAIVIQAPVGGRSIPIGEGRIACASHIDLRGWAVESGGRSVRPPTSASVSGAGAGSAPAPVIVPLAAESSCSSSNSGSSGVVELVTLGAQPAADPGTVTLDVEAGLVTLQGRGLRGAVLSFASGDKSGTDVCSEPQITSGIESCTFAVARGLSADPAAWSLWLLPAGSRVGPSVYTYDSFGLLVRPDARLLRLAKVVVSQLVRPGVTLDLQAGEARLPLTHPEAVASLECQDAFCTIDGSEMLIRGEHGSNETLEVQFRLRPHVLLRRAAIPNPESAPSLDIPIQRCPIALASPPLLRGVSDQALVLRLGGRCVSESSLQFFSSSGRLTPEQRQNVGSDRYVVLRLDRTSSDEVVVTVRSAGTTVGVVTARTRQPPALRTQLRLPSGGLIDFIPTNRDVELLLPGGDANGPLVPLPVEGAYSVTAQPGGPYLLRGLDGGAGTVALRFAYRDPTLPQALRELSLAVLNDPVGHSLHPANLPLALERDAKSDKPFVELLCEDGGGADHPRRMRPGVTEQLPYRSRDTCRVVLHRERLRPEDGTQALQLSVDVTAPDGTSRSDAKVDQRVIVKPGKPSSGPSPSEKPRTFFVSGVASPFDRVVVRVSIVTDDVHYATLPDDKLGAQLQWSIVMGTGHLRLYATATIPTGLYRVADQGHQGILTLNAGAILRLVWLSKEGRESPIGLETGLMWIGITGDTSPDAAAHGEFAFVAGLGLGIPIANQARAAQTSISLHAWFEYEVSRAARPDSGTPFGFVFGPSITVGDLGFNF